MSDLVIREATRADDPEILAIWDELSAYYRSLHPVFPRRWTAPTTVQRRRDELAKIWGDPENYVGFIAEFSDRFVGFCRAELSPNGPADASIHTLMVRAEFQRKGIGKALMLSAISWCEARQVDDVSLDVLPANSRAADFHKSLGFEPFLTSYIRHLR